MTTPSKPHANRPIIHITLQPAMVRLGLVVIASSVLLSLGLVGIASSPIVDGHPVLLTPERLAIKLYLDAAANWQQRLIEVDQRLALLEVEAATPHAPPTNTVITASPMVTGATLMITVPAAIPLPTLVPPISWPDNLYDRAQQADRLTVDLAALDREQQQITVPPALTALHTLARSTVQAFGQYVLAALDVIGAPVPAHVTALQNDRAQAQAALADFRAALEAQRQEAH